MKPLSYSSIFQYLECPLKYKFIYIDGFPKAKKPYLSFGDSLHQVLHYFYNTKIPQPPSIEQLLRFYQDIWVKDGYENENEEKQYFNYGKQILTEFYDKHIKDFHIPFAVENEFNIDVDGISVTGKIDRIEKLSDNKIEIIDYKSNKNPFALDKLKKDFQLSMYQLGAEKKFGLEVEKLTFYHLCSQTPFSVGSHSKEQINALRKQIIEVADGIQKDRFEPKMNNYCPCELAQHCPYFKHRYMPKEEASKELPEINIEELVDEYGNLKAKYKELDKREAELKEIFKKYFEEKGIKAVSTKKHQIYQLLIKKYEYSEDKVREILGPVNLLDKVLKLDENRLTTFLEDPAVPPEIKKELILIRKLKESIQIRYAKVKEDEVK